MGTEFIPEPTILYVDDQASHRILFERTFRGDWLVLTAATATEGLNLLKEHAIFLVLADQNMPGLTGIDFLVQAKEQAPEAARAILSAYGSPEIRAEAKRRAGIAAFLEKPWDRDQLKGFIQTTLTRYRLGIPTPTEVEAPSLERLLQGGCWGERLTELFALLEAQIDDRGRRRIILNFSEPRLRDYVPIIRRPLPGPLARAHLAALSGRLREMEQALTEYLKDFPKASPFDEGERH